MKECTWSTTICRQVVHVKVTSTLMSGPKVSHQNIVQSITLSLRPCLLPIVWTCLLAISSPDKWCTQLAIHVIPSFIALWSSSDAHMPTVSLLMVVSGQQGYSEFSVATQLLYTASIIFFSNFCYSSSSVKSDQMGFRCTLMSLGHP